MRVVADVLAGVLGLCGLVGCAGEQQVGGTAECKKYRGTERDGGVSGYTVVSDRLIRIQSEMFSPSDFFGTPSARETAKAITITWPVTPVTFENRSNTAMGCLMPAIGAMRIADLQLSSPLGSRAVLQAKDGGAVQRFGVALEDDRTTRPTITATAG
ncbi:hypothetical protein [Yimella sp. cx-51]|uniref:hypothetical protein n=1 Tax=Yimella sp. cx-51 TaxID=2770551 RepID=UPI00165DC0FD|nr:hypothetical protein [Yimella sp. cx-51]MBC9955559.1 hypothetical protein [Yimella sp. cx-51]QTH37862.1 hypothetical protein J5M86_13600 [Yimella sp. cx-51]